MEFLLKVCKIVLFPLYFLANLIKPFLKYLLIITIFFSLCELISIFKWEKKRRAYEEKISHGLLCVVEAPLKKIKEGIVHTTKKRDYYNDTHETHYDFILETKVTTHTMAYKEEKTKDLDRGVYSYSYNGKDYKYETVYSGQSIRLYVDASKPYEAYSFNDIYKDRIGDEKKKSFIEGLSGIVIILLMMLMVK